MSAEKIIEQIKKDSQDEVKQILKDAEKQASSILNDAKQEAKQESDKIIANGKKESENIKRILISKAHQDAKKEIMQAKGKIIDECFVKAHHELSIIDEQKYKRIVTKLMGDGAKKLGENCTVATSRAIDKQIAENIGLKVTGSVESSGGVILTASNRRITLDCTFDGILKREKDKIRIKVGKLLFS